MQNRPGSGGNPRCLLRPPVAALLLGLGLLGLPSCAGAPQARVARVTDGDTVILAGGEKVRIAGIDAPELRPVPEPGGAEAREALTRLVGGSPVFLEQVPPGIDTYGRLLARLRLAGGEDVGARLLREGHAEVFTRSPLAGEYFPLEAEARRLGRGLWASVPVVAPGETRAWERSLIVVEGRVAGVRSPGGHRFLDFRQEGREVLTAAVFREDLAAFDRDPASLAGLRVRVAGRLRPGPRGHPEIVVPHPSRIRVLEDAAGAWP